MKRYRENTYGYSYDPVEADLYVVSIWHEIEPEYDSPNGPQAAQEIIEVVATSPQDALELAKKAWKGPIDRIEIIDINPEEFEDDLPFGNEINASTEANTDLSEQVIRSLKQKYDVVWSGLAQDYVGGRGGSVAIYKANDNNVYRVWIDTKNDELVFQILAEGYSRGTSKEGYDSAEDISLGYIKGWSDKDIFDKIVEITNQCESADPNYTQWYTEDGSEDICTSTRIIDPEFYNWYSKLSFKEKEEVYDLAHFMKLPYFSKCSPWQLLNLKNNYLTNHSLIGLSSSTNVTASSFSRENQMRNDLYTEESYPEVDPKRISDLFKIDWNDVTAEDCEVFLLDENVFPDLSEIRSIRYLNDNEQHWADDSGYDGGYFIKYNSGDSLYVAWYSGQDDLFDVSDEVETYLSEH